MIEKIVKRSGEVVEFDPAKLNGWGEWASKNLGHNVDWSGVVLHATKVSKPITSSKDLQQAMIDYCLAQETWEYSLMAGKLYNSLYHKDLYGKTTPTVAALHKQMQDDGVMVKLDYTDDEYKTIESIINHKKDLKYPYYSIHQTRKKYAIRNKKTNKEYETPQFVYMRMAMALAEKEPKEKRMNVVNDYYSLMSDHVLNMPTPYYNNLGTTHNGYSSCCLYTTDDSYMSLAAGDHIAYVMTCMSAGIGTHIKTRSVGDEVRSGLIEHQGKLPYYRSLAGAIGANLQNGRGGAATIHYTWNDPEFNTIVKARNQKTPEGKRFNKGDLSFGSTKFLARLAAQDKEVAQFSYKDAPDLYEAMYSKDPTEFEKLYHEFLVGDKPRTMVKARDVVVDAMVQSFETGRHYEHHIDTINHHTPFKDKIYSSNLCQEIALPTKPFKDVSQLYNDWTEETGEVALCNICGIVVSNIIDDEHYKKAAYYALKVIDYGIMNNNYVFKSLEHTAKSRMNAGVGIIGLAHLMAKHKLKYDTQDGKNFIHTLAETHAWHLYNASLELGKELGNAPWMHKTKLPEGWLPIDTYEKTVDCIVTVGNKRDWEALRNKIVANGGIRNSVVVAHMPSESSSISSATTNGVYPIRELSMLKTNSGAVVDYVVPDSTKLKNHYQTAWDVPTEDLTHCYAIIQKFTDQAISADFYKNLQGNVKITSTEMLKEYLLRVKFGLKTKYYQNSLTGSSAFENESEECESCAL